VKIKLNEISPALSQRIINQMAAEDKREPQGSIPQRFILNGALAAQKREETNSGRFSVRVESIRKRLIDPDNCVGKFFLDCLRYSGILKDDTAADIEYTITQRKAKKGEQERTELTIDKIL
jgi:Holliday junction resolvase RusA-like endonuclease